MTPPPTREDDAYWTAAETANRVYGQWMPTAWIEVFIREHKSRADLPPPPSEASGEVEALCGELEALLADATPGPFAWFGAANKWFVEQDGPGYVLCEVTSARKSDDAVLIAKALSALPTLLTTLRNQDAEIKRLKSMSLILMIRTIAEAYFEGKAGAADFLMGHLHDELARLIEVEIAVLGSPK